MLYFYSSYDGRKAEVYKLDEFSSNHCLAITYNERKVSKREDFLLLLMINACDQLSYNNFATSAMIVRTNLDLRTSRASIEKYMSENKKSTRRERNSSARREVLVESAPGLPTTENATKDFGKV